VAGSVIANVSPSGASSSSSPLPSLQVESVLNATASASRASPPPVMGRSAASVIYPPLYLLWVTRSTMPAWRIVCFGQYLHRADNIWRGK
jgi:hypothetical protein